MIGLNHVRLVPYSKSLSHIVLYIYPTLGSDQYNNNIHPSHNFYTQQYKQIPPGFPPNPKVILQLPLDWTC